MNNRDIEYKMPINMARNYIREAKGADAKLAKSNINAYLCKIVNEEYGILGNCVNVITF